MFKKITAGLVKTFLEEAGETIREIVKDPDLASKLESRLQLKLMDLEHLETIAKLEADTAIALKTEETFQVALQQSDLYTKRTRPKIARTSLWVSTGYALLTTLVDSYLAVVERELANLFHVEVYIALAIPALTYMGLRGADKIFGRYTGLLTQPQAKPPTWGNSPSNIT